MTIAITVSYGKSQSVGGGEAASAARRSAEDIASIFPAALANASIFLR